MSLVKLFSSPWLSGSIVGLMATSSKRAYAICRASQVCCTHSPFPCHAHYLPMPTADLCHLLTHAHCWPMPLQETQKRSQAGLTQSLWDLWALVHTRVFWALWESLVDIGFDSKHDCIPPTILLGLLLFPWMWDVFFWGWDPTVSCSAARCNFGVLTGADELTSFYSTVLALTAL